MMKVKERNGLRIYQSLMKSMQLRMIEESDCFFSRDGQQIHLYKLLRTNICGSSRDVVSATAAVRMLRKQFSTERVDKLAYVLWAQVRETCDWIEDCNTNLMFVKSSCTYGHWFSGFNIMIWKGKK